MSIMFIINTIILFVLIIIINLLSSNLILIDAFNIDIITALVQRGPAGTHFGFSVSQHRDRQVSWLLVGAPLANTDQPGVERGGAVYRCSIDTPDACQQIAFDRSGSGEILLQGRKEKTDDKSNQWFGAVVNSGGENGMIVACAPRYVYFSTSLKRRDPVGSCWVSRGSFTGFFEYSPCRTTAWGYHRQGSCQAGLSASVTKDGKHLYIGAVGSWYWQGQVFSQDLQETQTLYSTRESPAYDDDSYLGYSTTVGEFSGDKNIDVAVGMPKGSNLTGKVILYTSTLKNIYNLTGDQMGEYFGYSLATADVNGDGFDDIIIGAPLYSPTNAKDQSYEKGRIYIAYQTREHIFRIKDTDHVDGTKSRARFGMSLACLGDTNKDGYDDIAVGAPYDGEKGAGAVYIFLGSKNGLQPKHSQVIYAESLGEPGLKTFGFTLSGGMDLDNNQYPDLFIGAYESDRAVFLRGRPVVNVTATLTLGRDSIGLEDKECVLKDGSKVPCVSVKVCLQYGGIGVANRLDFVYDIKLDTTSKRLPRIFFLNKEGDNEERNIVSLNKGANYCSSRRAYLSGSLRDKLTPIKVTAEYNLHEIPGQRILKPVLNQAISSQLTRQVNIRKNCGQDNICIPNLVLAATTSSDVYVIGSRKKIELDITVLNRGEDAFEAMIYLFMPTDVNYVNIKPKNKDLTIPCDGPQPDKTGNNILECDIGNPLSAGKKIEFTVIMEPSKVVSSNSKDYTFIIEVNSTNTEGTNQMEDNKVVLGMRLDVEVELNIFGNSDPNELSFNTSSETFFAQKNSEEDIGPEVKHIYTIKNGGSSTVKKAEITILWPTWDHTGNFLLYLVDQPRITAKAGKAFCKSITRDDLNPLGLKSRKGTDSRAPPDAQHSMQNEQAKRVQNEQAKRFKRDIMRRHPSHALIEQEKSCGLMNCTKILCTVYELATNDRVIFAIKSRLWKDSMERITLEELQISSKLVALVTQLPYDYAPDLIKPMIAQATTKVHIIGLKPMPIPLWLIILAIIIGLMILSGLIYGLWKLGFFKRKRPPSDGIEREPLSPGNGYSFRKGDTSL